MNRLSRLFGLVMVLMLALAAVGGATAQTGSNVLVDAAALGQSDVPTLDPSLATDSSSITVLTQTYVTLLHLHEELVTVEPGMAESYTITETEDATTFTFNIRQNVPWVRYDGSAVVEVTDESGDVRYVTAEDFAYGMRRTLDPETAANYQFVLAPWIAGATADDSGAMDMDAVGIRVVDEYTLEVDVTDNVAFLPAIFTMWITAAQPQWAIEEFGDVWIEDFNFQSYGPYALQSWVHDESVTLTANPFWEGTAEIPAPQIETVILRILPESVALAEYEAGNVDIAPVPLADVDRIRADATLSESFYVGPSKYTYYYGFNVEKAPFDDARVRRAFSMAIDRQSLIDNVLKGGQGPAGFFTRADVVSGPDQADYEDFGVYYDPEMAADLLQEYLDEMGMTAAELPAITLMHNASEAHASIAQAIQQMWSEALGVEVQIATQEWGVYLETLGNDAPQIFRLGWGWDYPDANSFLYDVFHSSSGNNNTNWTNAEFDALLEEARTVADEDARRDLYAEAENIITNTDAAIAPIYFYTTLRMTRPGLDRTNSLLGVELYYKWGAVSR